MPDKIQILMAAPRDEALPLDVQGVGMRRRAIELMGEVATINENSVRFRGASEDCIVQFGDRQFSTWQHNAIAVRFTADGNALPGICGSVLHEDSVTRFYSSAAVVRDPYN